ncbi:nicotinate-nucleotide adenylyltransferase [Pelistega indica]|uniref:Probable nicotinate-nucleotide adenylyltransferase n=1 Tax=Pelistega indica TaxID=1414851 RepID=V8G400_9BURK|nr:MULTISPECIES: nicotinate (nicotinamide) nucleotide adenylyltransferase [Pelistega]ETD70407.1 nicotinate-nucleotide adenylyltransferase [Pelistega indica]
MHKKKIGLFGGSFNPFHLAHLRLALTALEELSLDEVQLIPAGQPWQKQPLSVNAEHRLKMLKLAIKDYPKIRINTIELEREGPSYTIDTVSSLPKQHNYYWLMGSDQLNNFATWNDWQSILLYVQLVIVKRPHYDISPPPELLNELKKINKSLIFMNFDEIDLSSTEIRHKINQGEDVSNLIEAKVYQYIKQHGLYR